MPDKLGSQENWNLGWAHCYSLPREWSLDSNGNLVQRVSGNVNPLSDLEPGVYVVNGRKHIVR